MRLRIAATFCFLFKLLGFVGRVPRQLPLGFGGNRKGIFSAPFPNQTLNALGLQGWPRSCTNYIHIGVSEKSGGNVDSLANLARFPCPSSCTSASIRFINQSTRPRSLSRPFLPGCLAACLVPSSSTVHAFRMVGEMDCHCLTSRNSTLVVAPKATLAFHACLSFTYTKYLIQRIFFGHVPV